jgi:hypothetical protein
MHLALRFREHYEHYERPDRNTEGASEGVDIIKSTQTEVCATENLFQEAVGAASFPGRQPIRARVLASMAT